MAALAVLIDALATYNDTAAIPLAFISPNIGQLQYNAGEEMNVSWATPYDYTTVEVLQGPDEDGQYASSVVAANWTSDQTGTTWRPTAINGSSSSNFHFRIQKGYQPNSCDTCVADSPIFQVANIVSSTSASSTILSSSVSSATSSTMSSSTSSATSSMTSSAAMSTTEAAPLEAATSSSAVTSAMAATSSAFNINDYNPATDPIYMPRGTARALGIGLGIGGSFTIITCACLMLAWRRKRHPEEGDYGTRQVNPANRKSAGTNFIPSSPMSHERFDFEKYGDTNT